MVVKFKNPPNIFNILFEVSELPNKKTYLFFRFVGFIADF